METIRLFENDIEKHNKDFVKLLEQSFLLSFPQEDINKSSISIRIESLKRYIRDGKAIVYGSMINGKLGGFVWFFVKNSLDINVIHLNHIVVEEKNRGKGVGNALFDKVESYAIEKGIKEIELIVSINNDSAVKFYENKDFEVERLIMKKSVL